MFKVFLSISVFAVSFLVSHDVDASVSAKLTSVNVRRSNAGVSVDLTFDRPFAAKSLKPAFERDFIQLAMHPARLDSAKIMAVADSEIQKVFIYPYSVDTTRLRIILKRDNQWAKGRVSLWNNNPKSVRVFVKDPVPGKLAEARELAAPAAAAAMPPRSPHAAPTAPSPAMTAAAVQSPAADAPVEEKKLLAEVVSNTHDIDINNPDSVKAALATHPALSAVDKTGDKGELKAAPETGPIGITSDPSRHFTRMAIALFGVLALFIGLAFGVKKYAVKLKKLPFGKKERLIQVVASHYLGNKKSISLVKITGEYMVVGVSNDGISLISKLGPEVNVDKYLEDRFWGGTFEKHLDTYANDTKVAKEIDLSTSAPGSQKFLYDGVRDLADTVRDDVRLGAQAQAPAPESPVRASIRQKLTKLKPLA